MRKLILIAALSVLATQAYAGGPRSLSLAASSSSQPVAEQPAAPAATSPTPAAAQTTATQTATAAPTPTAAQPATAAAPAATTPATTSAQPVKTTSTSKPKIRQPAVEARVIRELHRHGVYW